MDFFVGNIPNNHDEVRGRSLLTKENLSRDSSMSSTKSSVVYHKKIEYNNTMDVDNVNDINPALFYEISQKLALQVSKAAKQQPNMRDQYSNLKPSEITLQYVLTKHTSSNSTYGQAVYNKDDNVINIQLPYNLNAPIEPGLWDGSFHLISLHKSIEHIVLDSKNIKDSLNFMAKYISNKQVDSSKSNNLENFHGIGEAVWNFILSVYQANWDLLYADKQSNTLRKKIAAKFTPKNQVPTGKSNKDVIKPTLVNIERIPPSISAKSQKEVNMVSKFFKSNKLAFNTKQPQKSYAQVSKQNINTLEIIKIKETFPSIGAKK